MFKTFIYIVICITCFQSHAQLKISGKTKLPDGTPFLITKKIHGEYIQLGIGNITEGLLNIELANFKEDEILHLIVVDGKNTEIQFISENEELEYIENDKFITGGIENKIRYNFFQETKILVKDVYTISFIDFLKNLNEDKIVNTNKRNEYKKKRKKKLYNIIRKTIIDYPKSFYSYTLIEKLYKEDRLSIEEKIAYKTLLENNFPYHLLNSILEKEISENKIPLLNSTIPNHKFTDINDIEIEFYNKLDKVTLVDFWSTNCVECRENREDLEKIYKKYNKVGFNIIRINTDTKNELLKNIVGKKQSKWIDVGLLKSENTIIDSIYNIKKTPSSFLIDSTGKIIAKDLIDEELTDKINEVLKTK